MIKRYIDEPYLASCEATVTEVRDRKVFLSQTVFYPEGGGQVGDTGWIGHSQVVDTKKVGGELFVHKDFPEPITINGRVAHLLAEHALEPEVDSTVLVTIDWDRRLRNMRHHSAAHLGFWFATRARPDLYTVGARIDEKTARFDFRTESRLTHEEIAEWEEQANATVRADLAIHTVSVDGRHEARVWRCAEMVIPCGGTHVRSTGEIGEVRLRRKRQGSGLERLYISIV